MTARLAGIARHARPRGPMETLDAVNVSIDGGIEGDCRGIARPGSTRKRQVTLMAQEDWDVAMAGLADAALVWSDRRANLLTAGITLPRTIGAQVRVGDAIFEITGECDPCSRMDDIVPGLRAALIPDWRGGRLARVVTGGTIEVGNEVAIVTGAE